MEALCNNNGSLPLYMAIMSTLVIKNLPPELHRKLKEQAARHRRSMTREAIVLLEEALGRGDGVRELPPPYRGAFPMTESFIDEAKRQGRE